MDIEAKDIGLKATAMGPEGTSSAVSKVYEAWMKEITDARKREKEWRKEATRVVELYEGEKKEEYQYNILYSNTETMQPALYNSTPRPVVQRRFKDADPMGAAASKICERGLIYLTDDGSGLYTSFDDLMTSAVVEALVPGRGVTRFKYDASIAAQETPAEEAAEGEQPPAEEKLEYETVCGEEVPWDRFLHGNAKKWKDVPWCAIEHFMTREELGKNFGDIGKQVPVTELNKGDHGDEDSPSDQKAESLKGMKVAQVYEIWDKEKREVVFICPTWKAGVLKQVPDPLQLSSFYPWPQPLSFMTKISSLLPVPLYRMYEEQAKELNRITVRINKITTALKVRGMYDATVEGISKVFESEDNVLVPAENVSALLSQGNALEKAIWLMPIEKLVTVLQQLYLNRQQIKTVIYEITGIADIMRGSSQASETLGAQQIKNQWGTLRLKKAQKAVMRYCRDSLRIMAEIAISKLSPETLKAMTGLPFPMQAEKEQMQMQAAQLKQQYEQIAMQAQQAGQQPPPPPEIPPEVQKMLSMPTWEELLTVLRNDMQRGYKIDIETNSTVDAEATEDKEDITEFMTGVSQFLNGVSPMVQNGTFSFDAMKGMMLAITRRYRFGTELEEQLQNMQEPQQANPEEVKKQQEEVAKQGQKVQQDAAALEKQRQQTEQQLAQQVADLEMQRKEFAMEQKFAQKELDMQKQFALREVELAKQGQLAEVTQAQRAAEQSVAGKVQQGKMQVQQAAQKPAPAPARKL